MAMDLRHLRPDRNHGGPIYLQLYRRYRDAIAAGKLRPGDRVPAVRSLASELNLARGTVELAYQMLASEGYLLARGPAGTFVSPGLEPLAQTPRAARGARPAAAPTGMAAVPAPRPFQLGLPALDAFPRKTWVRLAGRTLRSLGMAAMVHPDPAGYEPLRRSIAAYLGISRGIACTPAQVFVTNGYRGALQLACRALLEPGDEGWYEDPGYPYARRLLEDEGMRLAPVAVDEEGLDVGQGIRRAARARFAVVTPTHQSPLGMALSLPRRLELLEWAGRSAAWIVEDDYDSEFRYHGRPLPALKSLDAQGRVLYAGTFSKALFPGLRMAYLVAPQAQAARLQEAAQRLPGPGAVPLQAAVADFMDQGHFARHLRRMRALYAVRRGFLVDALDAVFGGRLHVQPQAGGIHVLAHLAGRRSDRAIAAEARARGLAVQALSDWRIRKSAAGGLLLGFANLQSADEARAQAERLRAAFDAAR